MNPKIMNYFNEQVVWEARVGSWLGDRARLLSVSKCSSDVRVYRAGDRVVKIRRLTPAVIYGRPSTLEDEYLVLSWLKDTYGTQAWLPDVTDYRREADWEMLEMKVMEVPRAYDPVVNAGAEAVSDVWAVARQLWKLNRMGVSHGDLVRSNAGYAQGGVVILDFDQAVRGGRLKCFLRDWLGYPLGRRAAQFTMWERFWEARGFRYAAGGWGALRKKLGGSRGGVVKSLNDCILRCRASGDGQLIQLAGIWEQAAQSGANYPGGGMTYYSLDVAGVHFPGERPWVLRWELVSRGVEFKGKRVVELGCNLGLLAIHAKQAGASKVVATDHNHQVVDAARRLSIVMDVEVDYHQADFDRDDNWETRLGGGDLVTALSLTYWLKDKDRLWSYLAGFKEVIFEGHESREEILARFGAHGFQSVKTLGVSDRNRVLFYASR